MYIYNLLICNVRVCVRTNFLKYNPNSSHDIPLWRGRNSKIFDTKIERDIPRKKLENRFFIFTLYDNGIPGYTLAAQSTAWDARGCPSFRCNTQVSNFANFTCDYLETISDSEFTVKTKNGPFFMNFPNISKKGNFFLLGLVQIPKNSFETYSQQMTIPF